MMHSPPAPQHRPGVSQLFLLLAGLIALAIIVIPVYVGNVAQPLNGEWFVGADTYMRMVRVQEWLQSGSWYANVSHRSNWPDGEVLHWTRPLDVALVVLAVPFWPFVGFEKALYVSGIIVSPVAAIAAMWFLLHGTRRLLDTRGQVILLVLFAFQPMTRFYFLAARPDHHSLILLAYTIIVALLLRFADDPRGDAQKTTWAGVAAAFGIWVSVETLTAELFALAVLALPWLISGDVRWLAGLRRFTLAGALALAVMLTIEHPPSNWLASEEYDRLSTLHVVLLALIALGVEGMWRWRDRRPGVAAMRWTAAIGAAVMAGAAMAVLYPDFFKGPFGAAMDSRLNDLWLGKIQEFQPLIGSDWETLIGAVYIVAPTVWLGVWAVRRHRRVHNSTGFDETMLILVAAGLLYLPLTLYQVRWGAYLGVTVAIAWAAILQDVLDWRGGPIVGAKNGEDGAPILRVPAFVAIALAHVVVGWGLSLARPATNTEPAQICHWRDLAPVLVSEPFGGGAPRTIFSFIHQGPEILYRTPHRVIGTPYHRNTNGIFDTYTALATTSPQVAFDIFAKRYVDLVVLCADSQEERHALRTEGDTMIKKITSGNPPTWLKQVALPEPLREKFRIFRFDAQAH